VQQMRVSLGKVDFRLFRLDLIACIDGNHLKYSKGQKISHPLCSHKQCFAEVRSWPNDEPTKRQAPTAFQ